MRLITCKAERLAVPSDNKPDSRIELIVPNDQEYIHYIELKLCWKRSYSAAHDACTLRNGITCEKTFQSVPIEPE